MAISENKFCIALSFDKNMFHQAKACISTIRKHCRYDADICVLALDLPDRQVDWFANNGVNVTKDYGRLPSPPTSFPLYSYAQICRPFLKDLFPGYEVYMWVDADIRFLRSDAFDAFLGQASKNPATICICQEVEPAYICVHSPLHAKAYHLMKNRRLRTYPVDIQEKLAYHYCFNTGIWAMHSDSPVWTIFQKEIISALRNGTGHMTEQDALNVSILRWGKNPVNLPATMNWLCALSLPLKDPSTGNFVRPEYPHWPISVLHLIMSQSLVEVDGEKILFYELYKRLGLTI